ncbi:histidinol-phosphate transaminase [Solicola sp. PLA-1-18]|uniref:histidinol-phosphate transaminase n=1 Tax=Solicola sp. PLA-1-18 TaxID=3380532 RepID=UPI003B801666
MTSTHDALAPRAALDGVPVYKPGRPPAPRDGLATYKLSSNENPYPPLPGVVEAVRSTLPGLNRYPDMGVTGLYERLAERHGVRTDELASGAGSVAVLYHLLQAYCEPGDEVVHAWRSFEAYPIAINLTGARSVQVPLTATAEHDLDAMLAAVTDRTRVLIVCTPNNPTGPAVDAAALRDFVALVPEHVLVVVDEAYLEFRDPAPAETSIELRRDHPRVVGLRTFSKAWGLAGLRIGYAVAAEPVATAIRACALPFGVSDLAQAAAVASLDHEDELAERVAGLVAERTRVRDALLESGWDVPDSQANFVWLPAGEGTLDLAAACAEAGVMVRPFAGEGARVTIGETPGNDAFLTVAAKLVGG